MSSTNRLVFDCPKFRVMFYSLMLLLCVICLICGCGKKQGSEIPPRPVQTGKVKQKDVPLYIDSFGTLSSPHVVDIKCQVTGEIKDVRFTEGKEVSKGDLLVLIDPRMYKAELDKAKAALDEDLIDFKIKQEKLGRNEKLFEKDLVSRQDFDEYRSDAAVAQARVEMDRANLEAAKLNLEYCFVRSPVDGLAGKLQVDPGNIVSANTGPVLVNIKTIDPLYIDFTVSERDLARVRKAMAKAALDVQITMGGDDTNAYSGKLEFLENAVDDSTGTIFLRALVPNKDRALWPGQFVKVRLILGVEKNALIVPTSSVQLGKEGYYLFAVLKDNTVDLREVTVGERTDDYMVIEKGVGQGETVVTVGQMGLAPGTKVWEVSPEEAGDKKSSTGERD